MKKPQKPTVAFLTHDWSWGTDPLQPNGCAWYRCKLPSDELNKRGWFSTIGFPGYSENRGFGLVVDSNRAVHGWDIIVFKLLMQQEVLDLMPAAKKLGQKIVVDIDDWFDGLSPSNAAHKATDPSNNPRSNREIYAQIIMEADAVITSTPFLFDYYGAKRDNVFMVRNGIDMDRWKKKHQRFARRPKIGWVGATHWRSNDLEQLAPFFNKFLEQNQLNFHHSGHVPSAPSAADLLDIEKRRFRSMGMAPILGYPSLFQPIDIGIIPLNNIKFNYAKSFIKGLEYTAAGIPFIASYSPEYEYLAEHGIGRVAHSESEWLNHLSELLDPHMRIDEANENYSLLKDFSMDARGDDWDATMRFIKDNL
jgi:glycosyltransferase involved in cell wall biosynthesis